MRRVPLRRTSELRRRKRPGPSARVNPNKGCEDCGGPISQKAKRFCRRCSSRRNVKKATDTPGRVTRQPDVELVCSYCGCTFYARPDKDGRQFCSQRCMGKAWRRIKVCVVCGQEFWTRNGPYNRTCSPKCFRKLRSLNQRGRHNPGFSTGAHVGRDEWYARLGSCCAVCGSHDRLLLHHVVYRQHVLREGGRVWDVRNAMTLCWTCHRRHHRGGARLPASIIPVAAIEFAIELLGAGPADLYFERYYSPG